MPRVMVFFVTLMFVLPSDGLSQAVPSPGDRIRIRLLDGTVRTGTLANLSTETIQLDVDPFLTIDVAVERVDVLDISLGQQVGFNSKKFWVTVAVLEAVYGTIYGLNPFASGKSEVYIVGFFLGAPIAFWVAVSETERWGPAALPGSGGSRLVLRPVLGSRIGFAASVRVGRFWTCSSVAPSKAPPPCSRRHGS